MGIQERKDREKEKRKQDIIDAAERLFQSKNFNEISIEELARETELSKGTIYLYFQSKNDIMNAVGIRAQKVLQKMFEKSVNSNSTAIENIRNLGKAYINFHKKHYVYFQILNYISTLTCQNNLQKGNPLSYCIEIMEKQYNDGSLQQNYEPKTLAFILWSTINGVLQFISQKANYLKTYNISADILIENQLRLLVNTLLPEIKGKNLKE